MGSSSFSARSKAKNFNIDELKEAIKYAKLRNVKVHLALNTLIKNNEFEEAINLAITAYNIGVDAIIIQDIGLATYLLDNYPEIPLHASTQMTVHNLEGVKQLEKLGFTRVVLSRELSIDEIEYIRQNTNIELEVFIHGALCISYSGECLLSSMIGGRSGNRGNCAQPCRLKYSLIEENVSNNSKKTLDTGFLMSPKDTMGIYYLPELIKQGINSLKIEGRMKTPSYVGTVTRIYRKYINLVYDNLSLKNEDIKKIIDGEINKTNESTNLSDIQELMQVFNRGGFETGHLNPDGNLNLIYKEKPNNMGIYLGKIQNINKNKGYINLKLNNNLSILDKISINNNIYNVSELMINNKNFETAIYGSLVTIGRIKGNINIGDKIYKIESNKLTKSINSSINKNIKKIKLNGIINVLNDKPLSLKVWSNSGFYNNLEFIATSSLCPEKAINSPINKDIILKQITKTGNTEFEFEKLDINLDNNLFIPNSLLNDLKRIAISGLENLVIKNNTHNLKLKDNYNSILFNNTNLSNINSNAIDTGLNMNSNDYSENILNVSLLLNTINLNVDYSNLNNIKNLYIPINFFLDSKYENILNILTNNYDSYVYLPIIIKDKTLKILDFEKIINKYYIKGFVISHISQLNLVSKFNLDLIGNYSLNVFNNYSIYFMQKSGLRYTALSPELPFEELSFFNNQEVIYYGKIPVMTNQYCYLGKTNKCYKNCDKKCQNNNYYYLNDRMNCNYRIIPDNIQTITTIYNHKPIQVAGKYIGKNNFRIDILDETIDEINNIIKNIKN